jgi:hypothetical protein
MWQYDFLFLTVSKINSTEGPKSVKFSFFFENNHILIWFMVFNATFNNISAISWWSVLLVEETRVSGEKTTDLSQVTDKL